jgi:Class II flagellar assembly regulator
MMPCLFKAEAGAAMRVSGQIYPTEISKARTGQPAGARPSFAVNGTAGETHPASSSQTAATSVLSQLDSLAALIALQGEDASPAGKRRKAASRGFHLLDALGRVRLGLLSGTIDESALAALQKGIEEARHHPSEPELGRLLQAIDTRAAVELAKLGR